LAWSDELDVAETQHRLKRAFLNAGMGTLAQSSCCFAAPIQESIGFILSNEHARAPRLT